MTWRWTLTAAVAGLASSALFSSLLGWSRARFVGAWLVVASAVVVWYLRASGTRPMVQLTRRAAAGLLAGAIAAAWLTWTVLRQPGGAAPGGGELLTALLWLGVVYGAVDALILSVLPVLTLYGTVPEAELRQPGSRLRHAGIALAGSLLVTAAYHVGFREFQGAALIQPLIGNAVITIAYLASGSPIAPLLAHSAMHVAAVLHGPEAALQLPPHY